MSSDVIITQRGHLGLFTLNRASALNALTLSMVRDLYQQLLTWQKDPAIHAVVITSAGGKAFCAGGDVRWLYDMGKQGNFAAQLSFFEEEYRLNRLIHHYPKPYIALMDGLTMGGGVGVSLHGSHPVASLSFSFAMPETSIGFFPDIGSSYLLSRCKGAMGRYLGLTGNRLNAEEAYALRLVSHVIQAALFPNVIEALLMMDLSQQAHQGVSECLEQFAEKINQDCVMALQSKVDDCFDYDDIVFIMDKIQQNDDEWHHSVLSLLKQKSPMSLCVTLMQLLKAAKMSFDECMQMDYQLVKYFMHSHDFYEGVRALLIDKDKNPQWQPAEFEGVNSHVVERYFNFRLK